MGIGEFSPTAAFQLEKNLQHAHYLVAAGMPLLLGLIYTCKKKFLESDNCKCSKMALKVGRFSQLHSSGRMSHRNTVQPTCCTQERGPEVFPHLRMKYNKTETPPAPSRCATSWLHTFSVTFYFYTYENELF